MFKLTHVVYFQEVIGRALDMIGSYGELSNKEQVVALIDEVYTPYILSVYCCLIKIIRVNILTMNV